MSGGRSRGTHTPRVLLLDFESLTRAVAHLHSAPSQGRTVPPQSPPRRVALTRASSGDAVAQQLTLMQAFLAHERYRIALLSKIATYI
jgi:hypothetical protein